MKRLVSVLVLASALSACATVDSFNRTSEKLTRQAIEQSELNRCSVHQAPCLNDEQFRRVNLELNKTAVGGREFTKLRIAGTATVADAATFLKTVATTTAALSAAEFPAAVTGALRTVLDKLIELQKNVTKLMGKM